MGKSTETPEVHHNEDDIAPDTSSMEGSTEYGGSHIGDRRVSYFDVNHIPSMSGPVMSEKDAGGKAMCAMLMYSVVVIGASSFLFGYDNAIISPIVALLPFVEKYQGVNPTTGELVLTANNQSLLFSVPLAGYVAGALSALWLQTHYGRVPETKGRTFAEIDELYARKVPKRHWAKAETSTNAKHASVISAADFRQRSVNMSVDFGKREEV